MKPVILTLALAASLAASGGAALAGGAKHAQAKCSAMPSGPIPYAELDSYAKSGCKTGQQAMAATGSTTDTAATVSAKSKAHKSKAAKPSKPATSPGEATTSESMPMDGQPVNPNPEPRP